MIIDEIKKEIRRHANPKQAKLLQRFFKTGKGEYGEGDKFLGITVPISRKIAMQFSANLHLSDLQKLIKSKFHEERLIALFVLVDKFRYENKKKIYDFYLKNTGHINNWDLVDLSAYKIVGAYLENRDKKVLYKLVKSQNLWERRIAVLSTFHYIKNGDARDALKIAGILLHDKHDLIHKAVGWMLREIGKKCGQETEEFFLQKHYKTMPRTMLRYAIERFSEKKRKFYLDR